MGGESISILNKAPRAATLKKLEKSYCGKGLKRNWDYLHCIGQHAVEAPSGGEVSTDSAVELGQAYAEESFCLGEKIRAIIGGGGPRRLNLMDNGSFVATEKVRTHVHKEKGVGQYRGKRISSVERRVKTARFKRTRNQMWRAAGLSGFQEKGKEQTCWHMGS